MHKLYPLPAGDQGNMFRPAGLAAINLGKTKLGLGFTTFTN